MKVDKRNPRHWLYLVLFGLNTLIAIGLRPLYQLMRNTHESRQIILYGHRLSGNLLALHRYITAHCSDEFHLTFLTMDPQYCRQLKGENVNHCKAITPAAIGLMCKADAVISDHGLHSMLPLLWWSTVKFFDVWHGIPFKGFDEDDFRTQHRYTETWVASPLMARLYEEKFGFPKDKIYVTGYARTDSLVSPRETDDQIRKRFSLEHIFGRKLVLFAPTWKQDAENRTLFPFGVSPETFLRDISNLCHEYNAAPLFRTHINTQLPASIAESEIEFLPFSQFPDTEALLQITDILICDWSSIAFDFLLLDRPTIFLDVPPPFDKGFSLGPEYRFDKVVDNHEDLLKALKQSLNKNPHDEVENSDQRRVMADRIYSRYADGHAAERCTIRLRHHLISSEFSQ